MNENNEHSEAQLSPGDIFGINQLYTSHFIPKANTQFWHSAVVGLKQWHNKIILSDVKLKGVPKITNGHKLVNNFVEPVIEEMYFDGKDTIIFVGVKDGVYGDNALARFNIEGIHAAAYDEFPVFVSPVTELQKRSTIVLPFELDGIPIIENGHKEANPFVEPVIENIEYKEKNTILTVKVKGGHYGWVSKILYSRSIKKAQPDSFLHKHCSYFKQT